MDADRTGTPQGGAARVRRHKYFAQQDLGAGAIHLPRACSISLGWSDHRERNPKIRPSAKGRWSYFWRSGWDSNPREVSLKLISSHLERGFDENLSVPLVTLKIATHSHSPRCAKRRKCVEVPLLTGDSISGKALNIKVFWNCKSGHSTRFRIVWTRCFRDNIGAYRKVKSLISQRFQGIQYVGPEPVKA